MNTSLLEQVRALAQAQQPDLPIVAIEPLPALLAQLMGTEQGWDVLYQQESELLTRRIWTNDEGGLVADPFPYTLGSTMPLDPEAGPRASERHPNVRLICSLVHPLAIAQVEWWALDARLFLNGVSFGTLPHARAMELLRAFGLMLCSDWRAATLPYRQMEQCAWLLGLGSGRGKQATSGPLMIVPHAVEGPRHFALWEADRLLGLFRARELADLLTAKGLPWERGWTLTPGEHPEHQKGDLPV